MSPHIIHIPLSGGDSNAHESAPAVRYPPGKPSSKEFGCSGGNPAATWRTIEMISCTISPRAAR
jgi:hypothetical protein